MSETIVKTVARTQKTTAVLFAVVFLLSTAGCCTNSSADGVKSGDGITQTDAAPEAAKKRRPARRRAWEYSRLPVNTPAGWQTSTIGI